MKYSDNNKPLVCMQTHSTCYKGTKVMTPVGVLWHSTGANNNTLKRYVQPWDASNSKEHPENTYTNAELMQIIGKNPYSNDWNHEYVNAGLNCWIGKLADGTVATVQTMPWNYRPWGCGSGKKGSCNSGWMQFEICEDGLTNKDYFNAVYQEACEITAYYCKMYNINPKGTVTYNGVTVPTILGHKDSCNLGLGSNHGDPDHWFKKHGKTMEDVRNDVAKLMGQDTSKPTTQTPINAVKGTVTADAGLYVRSGPGTNYSIVDGLSKGTVVEILEQKENGSMIWGRITKGWISMSYVKLDAQPTTTPATTPTPEQEKEDVKIEKGDLVSLSKDAVYYNGKQMPNWVRENNWYVSSISGNRAVIDKSEDGKYNIMSPIDVKYLQKVTKSSFTPYKVKVNTAALNVRSGPGTSYSRKKLVYKGQIFTIVGEQNGWGKLDGGAGWFSLQYTKKI